MDPTTDKQSGQWMHALAAELYPVCRSITGDGVRSTLERIAHEIPMVVHEVPSRTQVFDWAVPDEWNLRDAWIKDSSGRKVVDFREHNLHIVGYSIPVSRRMTLAELQPHLHSLPDQPDLIPYRTSYYQDNWGFCLKHRDRIRLEPGSYEVLIDSTKQPGSLTLGECVLPGSTQDEVIVSAHVCHPSLANDNLAGIAVAVAMARHLSTQKRKFTYRFLFIPGTIGSIAWLAQHRELLQRIRHGLVLTCAGDAGRITYKQTWFGDAPIDLAMRHVLSTSGHDFCMTPFHPYGYDERQYGSPGLRLPVGALMRSPHGTFAEYHTSADNLDFIRAESMQDTLDKALQAFAILETNETYVNCQPYGEPCLGKRGLYRRDGGHRNGMFDELAMLWTLNLSDGKHDLLAIANRSGMSFQKILDAANRLKDAGLLQWIESARHPQSSMGDQQPLACDRLSASMASCAAKPSANPASRSGSE